MAGEALEEALADILDPKIDAVANLIDGGRRDTSIDWGQAGYDAAIGAALSALGQGGRAAINAVRGEGIDNTQNTKRKTQLIQAVAENLVPETKNTQGQKPFIDTSEETMYNALNTNIELPTSGAKS